MKKIVALFVGVFVATACSAGQSPSPPSSPGGSSASPAMSPGPSMQEPIRISYLTHWPPQQVEQMNRFIARFKEVHPEIEVEVRAVPFGSLLSTLRAQAASPSGPTIVGIYDLWLPELVRDGIAAKAPDAQVQDIRANWPEGLVGGAVTVDGAVYGYPNEVDLYMLNYNKRLFAEAGIAGPPTTWDELISAAQKLTKRNAAGQIEQQGFGLINSWDSGVVHPWLSLVLSDGGQLLDGTSPQLTSQPALETTQLYQRLIQELKVTDPAMGTANASTTGPYLDNFVNGRTAMIVMANWWEGALRSAMGDRFEDVATARIPVGPHGSTSRSVSYAWLTVVNAHASPEQQAAAWTFLQWFHDANTGDTPGASAMGDLLMAMGILPSRNSDVEAFQAKLDTPFLKTYVEGLADAVPFPIVLGGAELTVAVQKALESVEFGQASPQDALNAAQAQAEQILGQYYR